MCTADHLPSLALPTLDCFEDGPHGYAGSVLMPNRAVLPVTQSFCVYFCKKNPEFMSILMIQPAFQLQFLEAFFSFWEPDPVLI